MTELSLYSSIRVLLPKNKYTGSNFIGREILIQNQEFLIIDHASNHDVNVARILIQNGETAGWLASSFVYPEAIFFDMDATVIAEESLVEIARVAGKASEVEALTQKAMEGGMDFAASLRLRLGILKGMPRDLVLSVKAHLNPGIRELADAMHLRNVKLFLVSGGFMDLAKPVSDDLGFMALEANRFAWHGDKLAGDVEGPVIDADGKRRAVLSWCDKYSLDPRRCVAVGDGANDMKMMNVCGLAVGFMPKKALRDAITVCNATGDHRLLLELLTR